MKVGFVIIASEVLDGKVSDTNTRILAEFLRPLHAEISRVLVIRDHQQEILDALNILSTTTDVIVTSGGLGPTKDDITKETLGKFFARELIFSDQAMKISLENYARLGRTFPGKDHGYCYLPQGFIPLSNSTGFAPGFYFAQEKKVIFSAPGVPREFKSMLTDHFAHATVAFRNRAEFLNHFIIRTKNIPEEKIFSEVDTNLWKNLEHIGEVCSLPILMGVDIGVKIKASSQEQLNDKLSSVKEIIENSPVKKFVWHIGPESLEEKIIQLANKKNLKFGFAESATGGLCSHRLTNIPGSSHSFMGSVVCYDESIKEKILGVRKETLKNSGVVSLATATEMAHGLEKNFNLDIAISITGLAGPGGGSDLVPVGTVFIGRSTKSTATSAQEFVLKGDREALKQRFSQAALYALLEEVEKFSHN